MLFATLTIGWCNSYSPQSVITIFPSRPVDTPLEITIFLYLLRSPCIFIIVHGSQQNPERALFMIWIKFCCYIICLLGLGSDTVRQINIAGTNYNFVGGSNQWTWKAAKPNILYWKKTAKFKDLQNKVAAAKFTCFAVVSTEKFVMIETKVQVSVQQQNVTYPIPW